MLQDYRGRELGDGELSKGWEKTLAEMRPPWYRLLERRKFNRFDGEFWEQYYAKLNEGICPFCKNDRLNRGAILDAVRKEYVECKGCGRILDYKEEDSEAFVKRWAERIING